MESSDDSFAWANASSDSNSSVLLPTNSVEKKSEKEMDSNYDNKEKLHEELFQKTPKTKKSKKERKRKYEADLQDNNDYGSNIVDNIKFESDGNLSNSGNDLGAKIEEETYLDDVHSKRKKKKKHKKSHENSNNLDIDVTDNTLEITNKYTMEEDIENQITSSKKSKKRKRKLSRNSNNESDNGNNEISIREKKKRKLNKSSEAVEDPTNDISTVYNDHIENGLDSLESTEVEIESKIEKNNQINDTPTQLKHSKKGSKISDNKHLKDENSLSIEHQEHAMGESILSNDNVKCFLSSNPQLKPSNVKHTSNDSEDEEQWILSCPAEINIDDFNNVDLVLGKNKIKINEKIYTQNKDESTSNVFQVKYHKNKSVMINVPIMESFIFTRRVPKPHISNDNIIINNQTNFIPLLDTKCRHPLFGEKYKKSIKVSKLAAGRLADDSIIPTTEIKKKKHKKEKTKIAENSVLEVNVSANPEPCTPIKKKKKKHSLKEAEHMSSKKIKLEKAETTWESEKAIEENLFNF